MSTYLPEEVLLQIFSEPAISPRIESDEKRLRKQTQSTLYNVSLASKRFNRIALPKLCESIDARHYGFSRLVRLLRTLVQSPELASYVRELRTAACDFSSRRHWPTKDSDWELLRKGLTSIVARSVLHSELRLRLILGLYMSGGQKVDAYLAIFFVVCLRLERWEYAVWGREDHDMHLTDAVFSAISTGNFFGSEFIPLYNLKEISVPDSEFKHDIFTAPFKLARLRPYVQLPWLRTLRATHATQYPVFHDQYALGPPSRIEHVELADGSDVDSDTLRQIMEFCPRLRTLEISRSRLWSHPESLPEIGHVLRYHGTGLHKLILHTDERWLAPDVTLGIPLAPFVSLQSLHHLTDLSVQSVMLTGLNLDHPRLYFTHLARPVTGILPFSLQRLEVHCFEGRRGPGLASDPSTYFDDRLLELFRDGRFENLRFVRLAAKKFMPLTLVLLAEQSGWAVKAWEEEFRAPVGGGVFQSEMRMWVEFRR